MLINFKLQQSSLKEEVYVETLVFNRVRNMSKQREHKLFKINPTVYFIIIILQEILEKGMLPKMMMYRNGLILFLNLPFPILPVN